MKRYILNLVIILLGLHFTSCSSSSDNNTEIPEPVVNPIELDTSSVVIKYVDKKATDIINNDEESTNAEGNDDVDLNQNKAFVSVLSGNGSYSAFTLNKDVASAYFDEESQKIVIEGYQIGRTKVLVADKDVELAVIDVEVYVYDDIILRDSIESHKFVVTPGSHTSQTFYIAQGNGNYTYESENPEIVTTQVITPISFNVVVSGNSKSGETNIIIKDYNNKVLKLKIELEHTVKPYTASQLAGMAELSMESFMFDKDRPRGSTSSLLLADGTHKVAIDAGKTELAVFFKGEKALGEVEGGQIEFENFGNLGSSNGRIDLAYLEIFKVKDNKISIAFSYIGDDGLLKFGYFSNVRSMY